MCGSSADEREIINKNEAEAVAPPARACKRVIMNSARADCVVAERVFKK
jgi:hypothetical protein